MIHLSTNYLVNTQIRHIERERDGNVYMDIQTVGHNPNKCEEKERKNERIK